MAVVQEIMLFGLETWVETNHISRYLVRFHHQVAMQLKWKNPWIQANGICQYPLLKEAMLEMVLEDIETYISRIHNRVEHFTTTGPILYL